MKSFNEQLIKLIKILDNIFLQLFSTGFFVFTFFYLSIISQNRLGIPQFIIKYKSYNKDNIF